MLSNVGSWASIISVFISIGTLSFSFIINRKVQKLKNINLFDKTIKFHLDEIDKRQTELNRLLPNISKNSLEIKTILSSLLAEFENICNKISDKNAKEQIKKLIKEIKSVQKDPFLFCDSRIQDIYVSINENHKRVSLIQRDNNNSIKTT